MNKMNKIKFYDVFIISLIMVLAGCGLIYEYIFSHYAGRVVGSLETTLYAIIGIMIVSMGIGSFLASKFKDPFTTLSVIESVIAILAITGIFVISGANALAYKMPQIIAETYNISIDMSIKNESYLFIFKFLNSSSYIMAGLTAIFIGMEIPLVARIRQELYKEYLEHNTGMVYGADYIGAGIGAFIWITILIKQDISDSIAIIAQTNVISGALFIFVFRKYIKYVKTLVLLQIITALIILFGVQNINSWQDNLENSLYGNKKIFSLNTDYQRIAVTEGINPYSSEKYYNFFINGRTQFSEQDEGIYHSLLVHPAMKIAEKNNNIMIIGGGDGLALREVLKFNPEKVTVLDLDDKIVNFFKEPYFVNNEQINKHLLDLNKGSFNDERVEFYFGDAYINAHNMKFKGNVYDVIIVDLPDPSHPDLNKMYSKPFYKLLNNLLAENGSIVIQSTSPYHAKNAFLSIKKTMEHSNFKNVDQYHANVPSFGEWGFTIASKSSKSPKELINEIDEEIDHDWLTIGLMKSSFEFGKKYYDDYDSIKVNEQGSGVIYNYHQYAWEKAGGYAVVN